ncbi:8-oxo-dGTP diphosphatase [Paenibacillus sp. UNCCL117]|uniref:NUDIX hydrolase n=1 Tax=unclassified Paenibacillus TaxID=185978 RepID=UPI000884364D|nr:MULTISPECIES: 8-oxo-dGTP diphosphatase [unclassified Paenibacillus]SDC90927.1 8-oxo-dGTP diphosphatase [Paenibacillus sp. cl123]SFW28970.1 8-oxo-dGTP diphosphatase [Paenibacillus sp. UNCCL117]
MLAYNICFIRRAGELLLLNRERSSWMGSWNGVGGKLDPGEAPRASVRREIEEETGIVLREADIRFKGLVTWESEAGALGGMYLYTAELDPAYPYPTPVKTDEGILDWKKTEWILHPDNTGVATNLPAFLPLLLQDDACYDHRCLFREGRLLSVQSIPVTADCEHQPDYAELRGSAL